MHKNFNEQQRAAIEAARSALDKLVELDVMMFYDSETSSISVIDGRYIDVLDFDLFKDAEHNVTVGEFFDGCESITNQCGNMPADDCFVSVNLEF